MTVDTDNLIRWTAALGHGAIDRLVVAKTWRHRLLAIPGRLVNRSGTLTLRLPSPLAPQSVDPGSAVAG